MKKFETNPCKSDLFGSRNKCNQCECTFYHLNNDDIEIRKKCQIINYLKIYSAICNG